MTGFYCKKHPQVARKLHVLTLWQFVSVCKTGVVESLDGQPERELPEWSLPAPDIYDEWEPPLWNELPNLSEDLWMRIAVVLSLIGYTVTYLLTDMGGLLFYLLLLIPSTLMLFLIAALIVLCFFLVVQSNCLVVKPIFEICF